MFENRIISLFITAASLLFTNHAYGTDEQTPPNPGSKRVERSVENSPADNFVISKRNRVITPLRENNRPEWRNGNDCDSIFKSMTSVIDMYNSLESEYKQSALTINDLQKTYQKHIDERFDFGPTNCDGFIDETNKFIHSPPESKKSKSFGKKGIKKLPVLVFVANQANPDFVPQECPNDLKTKIQFLNIWTQSYFSNMNIANEKNTLGVFVYNYVEFQNQFTKSFLLLRRMIKFRADLSKDAKFNWGKLLGHDAVEVIELQKYYQSVVEPLTPMLNNFANDLLKLFLTFLQSTGTTLHEVKHDILHIADLIPDHYQQATLVQITSPNYLDLFLKVLRKKTTNSFYIPRLNNSEFLVQEIQRYFQINYNKTQPESAEILELLKTKNTYPVSKVTDFETAQSEPLINHQKNILSGVFGEEHIEMAAVLDEIGCDTFNLLRLLHANIEQDHIKPILAIAIECCSIWQSRVYKYTQEHNNKSNAPSSLKSGLK